MKISDLILFANDMALLDDLIIADDANVSNSIFNNLPVIADR